MNGLPSWSFAGMRRRRRRVGWGNKRRGGGVSTVEWRTCIGLAQESQVYRERPDWVLVSLCRDLTPTV